MVAGGEDVPDVGDGHDVVVVGEVRHALSEVVRVGLRRRVRHGVHWRVRPEVEREPLQDQLVESEPPWRDLAAARRVLECGERLAERKFASAQIGFHNGFAERLDLN